jgi:hypothetical protein
MIGGSPFQSYFLIVPRTNIETVKEFFAYFASVYPGPLTEVVCCMDNHSAHKSKKTRAYLEELGIGYRF